MGDRSGELSKFYYQLKKDSAETEEERAKYEQFKEKGKNEYYESFLTKKK